MTYRPLTEDEKKIYENSIKRLTEEVIDLDLLVRSQQMTVDEVLAYNYKILRKNETAQLDSLKATLEEKKIAFEDCSNKLRLGVEIKEE